MIVFKAISETNKSHYGEKIYNEKQSYFESKAHLCKHGLHSSKKIWDAIKWGEKLFGSSYKIAICSTDKYDDYDSKNKKGVSKTLTILKIVDQNKAVVLNNRLVDHEKKIKELKKKSKLKSEKDIMINTVYEKLQNREIHPSGKFDNGGRWYAEHDDLISVRSPSRAFPYSQMVACRTLKYVKAVYAKYSPKTVEELIKLV